MPLSSISRGCGQGSAKLWQDETYDHLIRDERELTETWRYIEGNPVRKQIAPRIADYKWSSASKTEKVGESQSNSPSPAAEGGCATAGGGCATGGGGCATAEGGCATICRVI